MTFDLKTPPEISGNSSNEYSSLAQNVNFHQMLGSVYEPGLIDTMLTTNPTIQLGWLGLSAAMSQAQVSLKQVGAKDEIYNFVYEMLFRRLETRFQQVFLNALQALLYGVAPAEVSLAFRGGHWVFKDITARPVRGFDLYNIRKEPGEWWINGRYSWYSTNGALKTVKCGGPNDKDSAIFWWPVFGEGLLGRSLLRPIVNEHLEKCEIRRLRGAALRKVLFGTPVLRARERRTDESELGDADIQSAKRSVAMAATGNSACLYLPDGFEKLEILYSGSDGLAKSVEAENAIDIQILMALGSSHIARGLLSGYGSQGAGENDQMLQDSIRRYFFQWFAQAFQPLIDWIIDINFGYQAHYPELEVVSPSVMTIPQLSRTLTQLVNSGLLRPCEEDEEELRRLCRMPEQSGKLIKQETKDNPSVLGISGHYDSITGDTREGRDILYTEQKAEN